MNRPKYIHDAFEELDAAVLNGDPFFEDDLRAEFRRMMARWERGLVGFDNMRKEEEEE